MKIVSPKLLAQGQQLAHDLRNEGRSKEAQTVDALLQAITMSPVEKVSESASFLTTGEVAKRVGVSRQTVVNWVNKGLLPGVRLGGRTLIEPTALQRFTKLESILDDLDMERKPATPSEAATQVQQTRKGWLWRQKGK
jgi:excisionase family DNA binding protein